ncbi:Crp/Fnr family transcriptional regulator [Streptomyces boluensis]|uniref:Cyclic nucleotide-binding domain-containing protein n=1 Tax=Streptomyces boluensis TaxID=1775135 RepID=A0A964UUB9_9ACTN|nr:cyclic nucleotide-binding domain-containing protein [Streptomyces boluensis]NBE54545.1 cyclic nucleotide-binding domain-containing protein [Streptomyces boluensis]
MITTTTPRMSHALPADHRGALMSLAREVDIPPHTRLFNEGGRADHFWVVRSGAVALDMRVPGRQPVVIETLGFDELVGWSWLFRPHVWQLGAEAVGPVRAWEFDADKVREMCRDNPAMGESVAGWVGQVIAHRLQATRVRLLEVYSPYDSGVPG